MRVEKFEGDGRGEFGTARKQMRNLTRLMDRLALHKRPFRWALNGVKETLILNDTNPVHLKTNWKKDGEERGDEESGKLMTFH